MPCLLCEEKQFPVRSVPESLEKAANDSFAALSKQGLLEGDLMKAYISLGTCFGNVFSCRKWKMSMAPFCRNAGTINSIFIKYIMHENIQTSPSMLYVHTSNRWRYACVQAQLQLRKAARSFQPAEGPSPGDVPGESRGRGRGRGRGRARSSKPKNAKTETETDGHEAGDSQSEDDLEKEDAEIEEQLAKDEIDLEGSSKKESKKRKVAKVVEEKDQQKEMTEVTPKKRRPKKSPRTRKTPKLKRALAAARDGQVLDFWLQSYSSSFFTLPVFLHLPGEVQWGLLDFIRATLPPSPCPSSRFPSSPSSPRQLLASCWTS